MTDEFTFQQAAAVLVTLGDAAEGCRIETAQYRNQQNVETDEKARFDAHIFEAFYNSESLKLNTLWLVFRLQSL